MRKWLKEKRCAAGLTMKQIAEKLDFTESYYSRIENGNRQKRMDIQTARKLAKLFSIPVDDVIKLEEEASAEADGD